MDKDSESFVAKEIEKGRNFAQVLLLPSATENGDFIHRA